MYHSSKLSLNAAATSHFFAKKFMILPWPGLAIFFDLAAIVAPTDGFIFFCAGSSSENDSHAASSLVTVG